MKIQKQCNVYNCDWKMYNIIRILDHINIKKNVRLKICDAQLQSFKTYCWGNEVPVEQSTPV